MASEAAPVAAPASKGCMVPCRGFAIGQLELIEVPPITTHAGEPTMTQLPRSLFISHGGGPLPLLGDPRHDEMLACLRGIASEIPRPDAIVVVSAHWEEQAPTITAAHHPPLIYDQCH